MRPPRIVVTNRIHADVREQLARLGEVEVNTQLEPWSEAELRDRLREADAMMGFMTDRVDAALLEHAPSLRIVACALKGHDAYDLEACTRAGVWLSIVPDLLTAPTAELALGLAIGLARRVREGDARVRSGGYRGWRSELYGTGLAGAVVGVVGLGQVGRAIVERLRGFGCARLLGVDDRQDMPPGVEAATLTRALRECEYLFLAAPLTDDSLHLMDRAALERARTGLLLVNVGRGSVVDEHAVAASLADGRLGGYAADVFACEDWGVADRPRSVPSALLDSQRTLFTPHLGSAVQRVRLAIELRAFENIRAALMGRRPPDAINQPAGRVVERLTA